MFFHQIFLLLEVLQVKFFKTIIFSKSFVFYPMYSGFYPVYMVHGSTQGPSSRTRLHYFFACTGDVLHVCRFLVMGEPVLEIGDTFVLPLKYYNCSTFSYFNTTGTETT
jgi:hypothetical protein